MKEIEVTVSDGVGMHARTASIFAKRASDFISEIMVKGNDKIVNGKSMLNLMSLGVRNGMSIKIIADGSDDEIAVKALKELVENNFCIEV